MHISKKKNLHFHVKEIPSHISTTENKYYFKYSREINEIFPRKSKFRSGLPSLPNSNIQSKFVEIRRISVNIEIIICINEADV